VPAADPITAADPPGAGNAGASGADPEDGCRPDCPYRRVGHPAHPSRCHLEDGPALSYAAAQRIACSATVSWMLHDHDGTLLDIGRRHRKPTAAQRRAVRERDRYRCAFPGCQSRRTDLHHIRHWARGGTTSYWNLICLCQAHHVIVHEVGYLITRDDRGGFTFTRPDGTVIPASPTLPAPDADISTRHDATITPDTIQTAAGERMNLHLTIWAAFANARIRREREAG
jgi:5-methylcytosine-specific restriction endonuclease McrA